MSNYDLIIVGGSVSGLLSAREAASGGISVAVLEEDSEIGTPEHCGGLVSNIGLKDLGLVPDTGAVQNSRIKHARILSPSSGFDIDAERQNVIVLDRRAFDKQIAHQAQKFGAEIKVKCQMRSFERDNSTFIVKTSEGDLSCRYLVDARGVSSLISKNRKGVLQSAQYEVYATWIERSTIEVFFDSKLYPGFFAWIIPTSHGAGKIGVAGKGINAANALQSFIESRGKCSIVRKVYAPIWVNGPIDSFVSNKIITIGDAAGQSKPTTAGGIYSCGMGGLLAGRAVKKAMEEDKDNLLEQYQKEWFSRFGPEFEKMTLVRKLLERLDNRAIDELFSSVPAESIEEVSGTGNFDFHSAAVTKILGVKGAAKMAKVLLGNEIRRLIEG